MTVYNGPRCPYHPSADCPGGSCWECCYRVGTPVRSDVEEERAADAMRAMWKASNERSAA